MQNEYELIHNQLLFWMAKAAEFERKIAMLTAELEGLKPKPESHDGYQQLDN